MHKSYIHTTNFYGKKLLNQVNTPTKYIYYKKNAIKINILKLSSNKKWLVLLT
jgi:hypothetical protein